MGVGTQSIDLSLVQRAAHDQGSPHRAFLLARQDWASGDQHRPLGKDDGSGNTSFGWVPANEGAPPGQIPFDAPGKRHSPLSFQIKSLAVDHSPGRVQEEEQVQTKPREGGVLNVRPNEGAVVVHDEGIGVIPIGPIARLAVKSAERLLQLVQGMPHVTARLPLFQIGESVQQDRL